MSYLIVPEFLEKYKGHFYKLLHQDEQHFSMQYNEGLNIDILPFNPSGECS